MSNDNFEWAQRHGFLAKDFATQMCEIHKIKYDPRFGCLKCKLDQDIKQETNNEEKSGLFDNVIWPDETF